MNYLLDSKAVDDVCVLNSDEVIYFDVDETLVFWKTDQDPDDIIIQAVDPYMGGQYVNLVPHQRNIDLLKRNAGQGRTVIVWSAGGVFWAENVIRALALETYVDLIIRKPDVYVDDIPIEQWGLNRVYLNKHFREHPISGKDVGEKK